MDFKVIPPEEPSNFYPGQLMVTCHIYCLLCWWNERLVTIFSHRASDMAERKGWVFTTKGWICADCAAETDDYLVDNSR